MVALDASFLTDLTEPERDDMRSELAAAVAVRSQYRGRLAQLQRDGKMSRAWRWKLERQIAALTAHIDRYQTELAA